MRRLEHKIHAITADDAAFVKFSLSAGNASDAKEEQLFLKSVRKTRKCYAAYGQGILQDNKTREFAKEFGFTPVVPPKRNRKEPWNCDCKLYKERNGIERFFRRLKAFRCVYTRYDKLDVIFSAFIYLAIINMALRRMNTL